MGEHADHEAGHFASAAAVQRLEREERALAGVVDQAVAALVAAVGERPVGRVVDLGCGPGGALVALAGGFPAARIVAADRSPAMLARVRARAEGAGLAHRVETREVDLDAGLAGLGACEVVWAAMSVHHAADAGATLRAVAALLVPGGAVCLLEHAPGTGAGHGAHGGHAAHGHPHPAPGAGHAHHAEVGPALVQAAGLAVVVDRVLSAPAPAGGPHEGPDPSRRLLIARAPA